jgi:hypothetical protein
LIGEVVSEHIFGLLILSRRSFGIAESVATAGLLNTILTLILLIPAGSSMFNSFMFCGAAIVIIVGLLLCIAITGGGGLLERGDGLRGL